MHTTRRLTYCLLSVAVFLALAISPVSAQENDTTDGTETTEETTTVIKETVTKTTKTTEKTVKEKKNPTARVAIFIKNRAGEQLAGKAKAFEDLVTANITNKGYRVISREDTVQAISSFTPTNSKSVPDPDEIDLGNLLDKNSSSLRLAQKLQANYIVVGSLTSIGSTKKVVDYRDIKRTIRVTTLRVTYKILDGIRGSSQSAGTVTATHRAQQSDTVKTYSSDVINKLLDSAANKLGQKIPDPPEAPPEDADKVQITVTCDMQDLSIPGIVKNDEGKYVVTEDRYDLKATNVTVAIDGTVVGTAPGQFKVRPGLHTMRLTRQNFKEWKRTVNISEEGGQRFDVALTFNEEGLRRWQEKTAFLSKLKRQDQLTDAQAEKVRGAAQMMRQSGYRIDIRDHEDEKVRIDREIRDDRKIRRDVDIEQRNTPGEGRSRGDAGRRPAPPRRGETDATRSADGSKAEQAASDNAASRDSQGAEEATTDNESAEQNAEAEKTDAQRGDATASGADASQNDTEAGVKAAKELAGVIWPQ